MSPRSAPSRSARASRSPHGATGNVRADDDFGFAGGSVRVITVSNQSTGFCPAVECWRDVVSALSFDGVVLPGAFTHAIEFRRCPQCGELNLVKESWFVCVFCDGPLPLEWNVSARRAVQK